MTNWSEDLEYLLQKIEEIHPNPYHENSRALWEEVIEDVKKQLENLPGPVKITQFYRIISLLADSHSRVNLRFGANHSGMETYLPQEYNVQYPYVCEVFTDGVFITKAEKPEILGKQIVSINNQSITEVAYALKPYLPVENEIGLIGYVPFFMRIPLFLTAIGLVDDPHSSILLQFEDGKSVELQPSDGDLIDIWDTLNQNPPNYLKHEKTLSIREENSNLIVDIREIRDSDELSMRELADQLDERLSALKNLPDHGGVERLIIDLRENGGGNNMLSQPLIRTIIQHPWIDYPGKLFVCINRWTFSAAINTANFFERDTWALFAGEPFSGRVNHYGDSTPIILPHSNLEVKISTLYWQDRDPRDTRHSIMPDIPLNLTFEQYISGKDHLMKEIEEFEIEEIWHQYYKQYPPRVKTQRESQNLPIKTYLSTD